MCRPLESYLGPCHTTGKGHKPAGLIGRVAPAVTTQVTSPLDVRWRGSDVADGSGNSKLQPLCTGTQAYTRPAAGSWLVAHSLAEAGPRPPHQGLPAQRHNDVAILLKWSMVPGPGRWLPVFFEKMWALLRKDSTTSASQSPTAFPV